MKIRKLRIASTLVLCLVSAVARAEVTVVDPWVRGVVQGQTSTGAFMTIKSTGAVELIGVSSGVAKVVEIHTMSMDHDTMTMRPIAALPVPAAGSVELKPGSYHVMLIGLTKPLVVGGKVPLTLNFRDKSGTTTSLDVQAEIRALNSQPVMMKSK
jgi:copper(I)-binding protein